MITEFFCRRSFGPLYFISVFLIILFYLHTLNIESFESVIQQLPFWFGDSKAVVSVNDFGAKGDGFRDDTKAFEDAWKVACSLPSGSILEIPAGNVYLVRPINFGGPCQSKVTLLVSGTIVAPEEPDIWNGLDPRKWLYFHGLDHLVVRGGGIINGMGRKWWDRSCKINTTNPCQHAPTAITFHRCNNLDVRNLMIVNSQQMHMAFTNCYRVKVSHLKVVAPADSPNTDGIHISASSHVEVKNSIIQTGDDCISVVSNSSVVQMRNIICGPGHGISIGSLGKFSSYSQVRDILVDGAFLSNTENGLRIKTWQGGSGFVRDVDFRNVLMVNVSNPIIIDQYYCDSMLQCPNQTSSIKLERVSFKQIRGTSATENAMIFACSDNFPCMDIYLSDIQLLYSVGKTNAYCWKAFGISSGLVYPQPCLSPDEH
ncbi:pectin lyase-like superfamily protein [Tasmannia lanceolata]|uniref:pectin lyase-like superfamily protein n=1 Tax=Tasmannia lanceolata TaxID=3420 RepID=UPI0040635706